MRGWRDGKDESDLDGGDDVVRRRFVRVVGLPEDEPLGSLTDDWAAAGPPPVDVAPAAGVFPGGPLRDGGSSHHGGLSGGRSHHGGPLHHGGALHHGGPAGDPAAAGPSRAGTPGAAERALASFDPGRRGVRALAAVAVLVLAVAGFFAWRARPSAERVPPVDRVVASFSAPAAGASSAAGIVVVSVAGRVHRPGLVRLPTGSRVADAIEAVGGALPGTDLSYVNLARKLIDGELLLIGVSPPPGVAAGPSPAGGGVTGGQVNLNTATLTELQTLPGVGPVLAQRIVDYRDKHGGFKTVNDLRQVEGIGDAKFAQLKDRVLV